MLPEIFRDDVFRLETRRLWLRWPRLADAEALRALIGDGGSFCPSGLLVDSGLAGGAEKCIRAFREGNSSGAHLRLVATLKVGARELVGMIGVEPRGESLGFSYWLDKAYCGQGLAAEAAAATVDAFFRFSRAEEIDALAPQESVKSQVALASVGFRAVGQEDAKGRAGASLALRFALSRQDWRNAACG